MSARTPEGRIAERIIAWIRSLPDGHAIKTHGSGYGSTGEPDIDACIAGRSVKLEVKQPTRRTRVTPLQAKRLRDWQAAGALVGVVTSLDEAQELVNRARNGPGT